MTIPTASKVVKLAKSFVRSRKYGSPNQFTKWFGFGNQTVPWCAIFVYYCLSQTGGKELMSGCSNKAYCPTIYNWGKKKGYLLGSYASAKEGDIVLFDWEKDSVCDHVGFVVKDNGNGTIQTVEGNTSNQSNGNGGCVQIRTRSKSLVKGFVRLPYAKAKKTNKKTLSVNGSFDSKCVKALQHWLGTTEDGFISGQSKADKKLHSGILSIKYSSGGSLVIKALQKKLKIKVTGILDKATIKAVQKFLNSKQKEIKLEIDGSWGIKTSKAFQIYLNSI